jgi:hypothetical protein
LPPWMTPAWTVRAAAGAPRPGARAPPPPQRRAAAAGGPRPPPPPAARDRDPTGHGAPVAHGAELLHGIQGGCGHPGYVHGVRPELGGIGQPLQLEHQLVELVPVPRDRDAEGRRHPPQLHPAARAHHACRLEQVQAVDIGARAAWPARDGAAGTVARSAAPDLREERRGRQHQGQEKTWHV